MSDAPAPEVTPEPAATAPETPALPVEETKPEPDWKARSREWENRAKANADAAKELQTIKDRDLSELQRAQKAADEAAAQLAALQRQNALLAKGIPGDLTPPNQTAGPEEWAGYADRLLAWRGNPPAPAPVPLRPDPSQGPRPPESDQAVADVQYANAMAQLKPSRR
jgi:hypothetical protein